MQNSANNSLWRRLQDCLILAGHANARQYTAGLLHELAIPSRAIRHPMMSNSVLIMQYHNDAIASFRYQNFCTISHRASCNLIVGSHGSTSEMISRTALWRAELPVKHKAVPPRKSWVTARLLSPSQNMPCIQETILL